MLLKNMRDGTYICLIHLPWELCKEIININVLNVTQSGKTAVLSPMSADWIFHPEHKAT